MSQNSKLYRCGLHGPYTPIWDREIQGHSCPRVLCEKCEELSYGPHEKRPKSVKYYYDGKEAVLLQEAHNGSAVWKFDPPVVYPEWHFAEDLTPVIPEGALTSEETMQRMQELLPEVERIARENNIELPDSEQILMLPGIDFNKVN